MPRYAQADVAYGKKPAERADFRNALKLRYFIDSETAPETTIESLKGTGAQSLVSRWSAFGSDKLNSSVIAAFANGAIANGNMTGRLVDFTDKNLALDHGVLSGAESEGDDISVATALDYWRKEGIADYKGKPNYIAGYAALKKRDLGELLQAIRLFGWAGIGLKVYKRAENAFKNADAANDEGKRNAGELPVWDESLRGVAAGRVFVPVVGVDEDGNLLIVLWGRLQRITPGYYEKHSDEAWAVVTYDELIGQDVVVPGFRNVTFARAIAKRNQSADGPKVMSNSKAVMVDFGDHQVAFGFVAKAPKADNDDAETPADGDDASTATDTENVSTGNLEAAVSEAPEFSSAV